MSWLKTSLIIAVMVGSSFCVERSIYLHLQKEVHDPDMYELGMLDAQQKRDPASMYTNPYMEGYIAGTKSSTLRRKKTVNVKLDHSKGFRPYEDRVPIPVRDWMIKDPSIKKGE